MIANRPTSVQHRLLDDTYVYDPNGNVKQITDNATGRMNRGNRTMTYDGLDRLKTAVSPMWGGGTASYAYDALDNLTRVVVPSSRNHYYCYDANLLTNVKTGGCTGTTVMGLGYDPQGNVINKSGVAYHFDFGNRLRGVSSSSGTMETYRYDGLGRRVLAWAPGTGNVLSQYSQGGQLVYQHDERTSQRIDYLYLGGSLVASRTRPFGSSTATIEYQHTDGLGSPVATSDATGSRLRYDDYEPYGRRMNRANDNRPGHTGHVMDQNTALTYMQQRYYDPAIGMFLSVDPVTAQSDPIGQFHRYRYANNNPYRFTDPDGRIAHIVGGGIVGGLIGGGVELYKQASSGQEVSWGRVGGEALKGAAVGAATAALPGAGTALALGANGTRVLTATGSIAAGSAGEATAQAVRGETLDGAKIAVAGVSNVLGVGAGSAVAAPARAASTVTTEAIEGVAVTSLRGRTFTIGAVPATSSTSVVQQQAIQDVVGESASSAMNEAINKRIDRNP